MNIGILLGLGARERVGGIPLLTDQEFFASAMFPFENGRTNSALLDGQFTLTNFGSQVTGTNSATDYWRGAYSCVAFCDPHRERVDAQNFFPFVFGSFNATTANRSTGLRYYPLAHSTAAKRQRFEFWVRGESGPGLWLMESAVIPSSAKGPFAVWAWNDGTTGYLHVLDIDSGTWYDGAGVARPASHIGISAVALGNPLTIGSAGNAAFPAPNPSPQSAVQWRGSIGDLLFCNDALSKADIESIVNGADPVTVATGAGATVYAHVPMTSGGAITSTVNQSFTGISLTQQGAIYPGQTMRRQGSTNWITLDPYSHPEHFPVANGATTARVRLKGNVGGLTGNLQWRMVKRNGDEVTGWANSGITVSGGAFDGYVTCPEFTGKAQVQVRMSSNEAIVAASDTDAQAGPVVEVHAQSEGVFATTQNATTTGGATPLGYTLPANSETLVYAAFVGAPTVRHLLVAEAAPGYLGDGCAAINNYVRSKTQRSVLVRVNAVGGTSQLALMNDADTTRNWSDLEGLRALSTTLGASGESVVTGHVIFGWEAEIGPTNVMPVAYRPLLTGVGASSGVYDRSNNIPTADIDHFLYDGSSSDNARMVIAPSNRATTGAGAGATDSSIAGDRRDHFRNYSHIYNYVNGPETTAHKMQGENAAGGLPTGSVTHPEPNDWEGSIETGLTLAEAILQAAGNGAYPGPVFFESIAAGTAANKVKVTLGLPRLNPGDGIAEGATGYSTAAQSGSYTYALHVKKNGGDPGAGFEASIDGGAWSKANVTSGVITNAATGEVELTLASTPTTSVAIRYLPGSTGRYSSATITQENWRSGVLYFTGSEYAAGEPNSVDDLLDLGWQVAGSNQALTLAL